MNTSVGFHILDTTFSEVLAALYLRPGAGLPFDAIVRPEVTRLVPR